jgi:hypothetical protein
MELAAAILLAGPLGYLGPTARLALLRYLALWAVLFPIQTAVVHSANPDDIELVYFVLNAVILGLGIALNQAGHRWRLRRRTA